jgi:hypothetical protein
MWSYLIEDRAPQETVSEFVVAARKGDVSRLRTLVDHGVNRDGIDNRVLDCVSNIDDSLWFCWD